MTHNAHDRLVGSYKQRDLNETRLRLVNEIVEGPVLDIGCGDGGYVEHLSPEYKVVGLDVLEYTHRSRIVRGDALNLPFQDGAFGTVLLFEVLEHLDDPCACLDEIRRVATDTLVMSVPNAIDPLIFETAGLAIHPFVDPTHVNNYNEEEIRETLQVVGFRNVEVRYINRVKPMKLLLYMLGVNFDTADTLGYYFHRLLRYWPASEEYFMTMLITADI